MNEINAAKEDLGASIAGKKGAERADGWSNILTGLGILNRDKNSSGDVAWEQLDYGTLGELYAGDAIAAKVIDDLPHEMLREGFELKAPKYKTLDKDMGKYLERLDAYRKLEKAMKWGRLYGGAVLLMGLQDGQKQDKPVAWDRVQSVQWLTILHRWQITIAEYQEDIDLPGYMEPALYLIPERNQGIAYGVVRQAVPKQYIHASRCILFPGVELPDELMIQNGGWGDSVLTRMWNAIRNFNTVHDSTATIVHNFSQAVVKLKNLHDMLQSGRDDQIRKRLALLNTTSSILNSIVINEGEEYERQSISMSGLPEVINQVAQRLVAVTNMPHTRILGESPSGLGATGESEQTGWYDHVSDQQETYFKPRLTQLLDAIYQAKDGPTGGQKPEDACIEFNSLEQMNDSEWADIHFKQAQADDLYIKNAVVDPTEIANSRFGGEVYSLETKLDEALRDDMGAIEAEQPEDPLQQQPPQLEAGQQQPVAQALPGGTPPSGVQVRTQDSYDPKQARDKNGKFASQGGGSKPGE